MFSESFAFAVGVVQAQVSLLVSVVECRETLRRCDRLLVGESRPTSPRSPERFRGLGLWVGNGNLVHSVVVEGRGFKTPKTLGTCSPQRFLILAQGKGRGSTGSLLTQRVAVLFDADFNGK